MGELVAWFLVVVGSVGVVVDWLAWRRRPEVPERDRPTISHVRRIK